MLECQSPFSWALQLALLFLLKQPYSAECDNAHKPHIRLWPQPPLRGWSIPQGYLPKRHHLRPQLEFLHPQALHTKVCSVHPDPPCWPDFPQQIHKDSEIVDLRNPRRAPEPALATSPRRPSAQPV